MQNPDEVTSDSIGQDTDPDPAAASYTPAPATSPAPAPQAPSRPGASSPPPVPAPAPPERRRPSFTETEEYTWLESLPRAKTKAPDSPPRKTQPEPSTEPPPYVLYRVVERRVIVAVTLKVLAELK